MIDLSGGSPISRRRPQGRRSSVRKDELTEWWGFVARLRVVQGLGDWGSFRVRLHRIESTDSKRDYFFLHGGEFPGSGGCIDVGGGLDGDANTERLLGDIRRDADGVVPLIVWE